MLSLQVQMYGRLLINAEYSIAMKTRLQQFYLHHFRFHYYQTLGEFSVILRRQTASLYPHFHQIFMFCCHTFGHFSSLHFTLSDD